MKLVQIHHAPFHEKLKVLMDMYACVLIISLTMKEAPEPEAEQAKVHINVVAGET